METAPEARAIGNKCSAPFYDAGFIEVDLTGQYAYVCREVAAIGDDSYCIAEVDIFGLKNIFGSATPISSYTPVSAELNAKNLVTNLRNRSHLFDYNPSLNEWEKSRLQLMLQS